MIKNAGILALIVCLLLVLLSPGLVQARSKLAILDSSAKAEFPFKLNFNLSAESDVNIIDIRLHYVVDQASSAQVISEVYIEFVPDTTVDVTWTWDMRKTGGLPPGSNVDYWWVVEDADGEKVEADQARIQFDDNRYYWYKLNEGNVTIYWHRGTRSFARELMAAAQQALTRLTEDTGAYLEKPVKLYIYANAQDLREAMIYPQEWTGGVAFTRHGVIAIGIASGNLDWGKRAVAHELAHLVNHQMTFNPYGDLPRWLDEGLAMYAEGPLKLEFEYFLDEAVTEESLIPVRSLSSPFSAYAGQSYLSYAQSYSLVEFLIDNYGQEKMLQLLNTFKRGIDYDTALEKVYGFDMDGLDALWRDYIAEQYQHLTVVTTAVRVTKIPDPVIAGLAVLATAFLLALGLAAERWAWRRGR